MREMKLILEICGTLLFIFIRKAEEQVVMFQSSVLSMLSKSDLIQ